MFLINCLLVPALLCQLPVSGQDPMGSRAEKTKHKVSPPQRPHLPDLVISNFQPTGLIPRHYNQSPATFTVGVRNDGDKGFDSANVKGPIELWFRVWKPAKEQSLTDSEPKATSFVWGTVKTVEGLKAGESKFVEFEVSPPPGGWEMSIPCEICPYDWAHRTNPVRLRIIARVDPKNVIKESNDSNNDRFPFETAPAK